MPALPPPCSTPAPATPLGLSGRVGPPRKGEGRRRRFEALLQCERIMLLEVVRLAHQAPDHRGDDAGGGREHEGGGRVAGAQEKGVEADQAGQDQDKLHRFLLAAMLKKAPRNGTAPVRRRAGARPCRRRRKRRAQGQSGRLKLGATCGAALDHRFKSSATVACSTCLPSGSSTDIRSANESSCCSNLARTSLHASATAAWSSPASTPPMEVTTPSGVVLVKKYSITSAMPETMPRLTGPFHGWNGREPLSRTRASGFTQSRRAIPLPPCGGGPTRAKSERGGGAGHRAPGRSRPAVPQPQGQGPRDPSGPAPAADRLESPRRLRCSMPGAPLLAPPSAESVLPTGGGGAEQAPPCRRPPSPGRASGATRPLPPG